MKEDEQEDFSQLQGPQLAMTSNVLMYKSNQKNKKLCITFY